MKNQKSAQLGKESGEGTNSLAVAEPTTAEAIRSRIFTTRGVQVMLDRDLSGLYGVSTGALNQAVKRNKNRFPERFMFQLNKEEAENLKSQSVIASWGGSRSCPYAFTEQGIAMLSSVLRNRTSFTTAFSSSTNRHSYMSGHRSTILARNALRSHRLTSPTYQISWRSFKVIVSREAQERRL